MEPVKGGALVNLPDPAVSEFKKLGDAEPVSYALRYAASFPEVFMVLSGMGNMEMMNSNIRTMHPFVPLNDAELEATDKVRDIIRQYNQIPCTKCKYCLDACPQQINIPKFFDLYNNEKMLVPKPWSAFGYAYCNYSKLPNVSIASDCTECGICIEECPQHIDIPEVMKDVAETFETDYYGFGD